MSESNEPEAVTWPTDMDRAPFVNREQVIDMIGVHDVQRLEAEQALQFRKFRVLQIRGFSEREALALAMEDEVVDDESPNPRTIQLRIEKKSAEPRTIKVRKTVLPPEAPKVIKVFPKVDLPEEWAEDDD